MGMHSTTEEGNEAAGLFLTLSSLSVMVFGYLTVLYLLGVVNKWQNMLVCAPAVIASAGLVLFYEFGGTHVNGKVLGVCVVLALAASGGFMGYAIFSTRDLLDDNNPFLMRRAGLRAKRTLEHGDELKRLTVRKTMQLGSIAVVPLLFVYGVLAFLVVGIFGLFQLSDEVAWQVFVTGVALAIKIVGNKVLLGLVSNISQM
jgi:hypothetical protein